MALEQIEAIVKWVVADIKAICPSITLYDDTCLRKEVAFQVHAAIAVSLEAVSEGKDK